MEDDQRLADLVKRYLGMEGFEVLVEGRGDRAVQRVIDSQPDLLLLDINLPGMDGFEVCRQLQTRWSGPIVMLTARDDEMDEVVGLELGADDYIVKPVKPRVLLARVRSRLRGASAPAARGPALRIGTLELDDGRREVRLDGRVLELTDNEFDLLRLLARNVGQILDRETIFGELRGIAYDGMDRSMDLRISRLRAKLGDDPARPRWIRSVRGRGYMLVRPS